MMKRVQGADKDKLELMGHTSTEMLRHYQDASYDLSLIHICPHKCWRCAHPAAEITSHSP